MDNDEKAALTFSEPVAKTQMVYTVPYQNCMQGTETRVVEEALKGFFRYSYPRIFAASQVGR